MIRMLRDPFIATGQFGEIKVQVFMEGQDVDFTEIIQRGLEKRFCTPEFVELRSFERAMYEGDIFRDEESAVLYHLIYGLSAGFPLCCIINFIRFTALGHKVSHTHARLELTNQPYAKCPAEVHDE